MRDIVAARLNEFPLHFSTSAPSSLHFTYLHFSDAPLIIPKSVIDGQKGVAAGRHAEGAAGVDAVGERHTVATHRHDSPDLKGKVDV